MCFWNTWLHRPPQYHSEQNSKIEFPADRISTAPGSICPRCIVPVGSQALRRLCSQRNSNSLVMTSCRESRLATLASRLTLGSASYRTSTSAPRGSVGGKDSKTGNPKIAEREFRSESLFKSLAGFLDSFAPESGRSVSVSEIARFHVVGLTLPVIGLYLGFRSRRRIAQRTD